MREKEGDEKLSKQKETIEENKEGKGRRAREKKKRRKR